MSENIRVILGGLGLAALIYTCLVLYLIALG